MNTRRFSLWIALALGCLLAALPACSLLHRHPTEVDTTPEESAPGIVGRRTSPRGLSVTLKVTPDPVKLGEIREVVANVVLKNNLKQASTLKFANEQVLEIQWVDVETGQVLSKWSTDREFRSDSRVLPINACERLEFNEKLTTRELKPGKVYNLEAFFIGYQKELRAIKAIIPQP